MPFASRRQMKWMFANKPAMAKKWAKETRNIEKLPEHAAKRLARARGRIHG